MPSTIPSRGQGRRLARELLGVAHPIGAGLLRTVRGSLGLAAVVHETPAPCYHESGAGAAWHRTRFRYEPSAHSDERPRLGRAHVYEWRCRALGPIGGIQQGSKPGPGQQRFRSLDRAYLERGVHERSFLGCLIDPQGKSVSCASVGASRRGRSLKLPTTHWRTVTTNARSPLAALGFRTRENHLMLCAARSNEATRTKLHRRQQVSRAWFHSLGVELRAHRIGGPHPRHITISGYGHLLSRTRERRLVPCRAPAPTLGTCDAAST
jgi:hypothetical protein